MAKKAWIAKAEREPRFAVRKYNRCKRCGRSRAYIGKFHLCRICFRELAVSGEIPGIVKVSAEVTNTGETAGHEVIQLYTQDLVGSVTRPVKELKGFKRIYLKPGETKTVTFDLPTCDLKFYDINMEYNVEPGDFKVWIGPNSTEGLEGCFELL